MTAKVEGETGVAVIGYGYAARTFHAPLVESVAGLALRVVASSDPAKVRAERPWVRVVNEPAHAFAAPDVELVVIATPNETHFALALAALRAGKHVVVDKPFTLTVAEASDLSAVATRAKRLLSVFHNRRWDADYRTVRRLLGTGRLGRPVHFESHFDRYRPAVAERWRERSEPGAGLWYDLGPHLVDQALQLFGRPDAIYADLAVQRDGGRGIDYFHALLSFDRLRVLLHAGSLVPSAGPRFIVHGTQGTYVKRGVDIQEAALKAGARPGGAEWGEDPVRGELTRFDGERVTVTLEPNERGDYAQFYAAVRAALAEGRENPVSPNDAVDVMRVIEAGIAGSASKTAVALR